MNIQSITELANIAADQSTLLRTLFNNISVNGIDGEKSKNYLEITNKTNNVYSSNKLDFAYVIQLLVDNVKVLETKITETNEKINYLSDVINNTIGKFPSYLPLSGGTLSGTLKISSEAGDKLQVYTGATNVLNINDNGILSCQEYIYGCCTSALWC